MHLECTTGHNKSMGSTSVVTPHKSAATTLILNLPFTRSLKPHDQIKHPRMVNKIFPGQSRKTERLESRDYSLQKYFISQINLNQVNPRRFGDWDIRVRVDVSDL